MINYNTNTIREQLHSILLHENEEDTTIIQVLDVSKASGIVREKEIYPGPAIKLHLTTNYDSSTRVEKMPDSAYSAPVIVPSNDNYEDLIVTVTPYPPDATWRLTCSDNVVLSDANKRVFRGKQSVTIKFTDDNSEDRMDYCWIQPIQATNDIAPTTPFKFRFFVKRVYKNIGSQEGSIQPLYKWTFNNSSNPLVDEMQGMPLNTRPWNPVATAPSHFTAGVNGSCLVRERSSFSPAIEVNGTLYFRAESNDLIGVAAAFAWISDNDNPVTIYTTKTDPASGDPVYGANDAATEDTVTKYGTPNGNAWFNDHLNLLAPGETDFTNTELALSVYTAHARGGFIGFGGSDGTNGNYNLNLNWSYYTYGVRAAYQVGPGNINDTVSSTTGWNHWTINRSRYLDPKNPDHQYTQAKGWGFIVERGLRWETYLPNNVGNKAAYLRDSSKDETGYYAWSWIDPSTDGSYETPPYTTIYTQTETPFDAEDKKYTDVYIANAESETGFTKQGRCQVYYFRWTYRDDRYNSIRENGTPYIKQWWNGANNYNAPSRYYFCVVSLNNSRWMFSMNTISSSQDPTDYTFTVSFDNSESTSKDKIDEIYLFNKMLLPDQVSELAGFCVWETASEGNSLLNLNLHDVQALYEITVANSTYVYDPDYTIFWADNMANNSSMSGGRLGWRKIDGDGPDVIWNNTFTPKKGEKCYATADAATTDNNLSISNVSAYNAQHYPMKCVIKPYVIDETTIGLVVSTHTFIENRFRAHYQTSECAQYDYEQNRGGWAGDKYYDIDQSINLNCWATQNIYQPIFVQRMDDESNYDVDGDPVKLYSRFYTCAGLFRLNCIQFRNSKPGDPYYAKGLYTQGVNWPVGDFNHVAYLKLNEPMVEGSTHTVTWLGNSATFTYSKNDPCIAIKVNHEGYLPWAKQRYAYFGYWLGSAEAYVPTIEDFHFYVMPSWADSVEDAAYSSVMTLRTIAGQPASENFKCDVYAAADNKPLDGENVYQIDFSNFDTTTKEAITSATGKTYLRDYLEDFTAACITVNGRIYYRTTEKDTCNCYAWTDSETLVPPVGGSSFTGPTLLYTDTHIPEIGEKCKLGFDDDPNDDYEITNVRTEEVIGWTTERATMDDWANCETVFMYKSDYTGGNIINAKLFTNRHMDTFGTSGSGISITNYVESVETHDISGEYQIYIPHIGWSYKFLISNQSWGHMYWTYMRGLYHQRSGCGNVKHPWTNWQYMGPAHEIANEGCFLFHMDQSNSTMYTWKVDPTTHEPILSDSGGLIPLGHDGRTSAFTILTERDKYGKKNKLYDVYGGWFDAADFDRRPSHMIIIFQLANAYLRCPENFSDNQNDLPESGDGIPDILSEAMWGCDMYRRMQTDEGGVGAWIETKAHESDWPWRSTMNYYTAAPSKSCSMAYARNAATLARALKVAAGRASTEQARDKMLKLADMYTESACAAWEFAAKECSEPYTIKPDNERNLVYINTYDETFAWREHLDVINSDSNFSKIGDFSYGQYALFAACALYVLTKEPRFRAWITDKAITHLISLDNSNANWVSELTPFEIVLDLADEFPSAAAKCRTQWITNHANGWINNIESYTYRFFNWKPGHTYMNYIGYGVFFPATRAACLILAWLATHEDKYRDTLINALDHMVGCNCMNVSWTSGLGHNGPPRYQDHFYQRQVSELGKWSPRPGVTPWRYNDFSRYNGSAGNAAQLAAMTPKRGAYTKVGYTFAGANFCLAPHDIVAKYHVDNDTLRNNYFYLHVPSFRYIPNFNAENIYVGVSEFTIDTTFSMHCAIAGMLMGPGWKPRSWYKQIAPVDKCEDVDGFMHMP